MENYIFEEVVKIITGVVSGKNGTIVVDESFGEDVAKEEGEDGSFFVNCEVTVTDGKVVDIDTLHAGFGGYRHIHETAEDVVTTPFIDSYDLDSVKVAEAVNALL